MPRNDPLAIYLHDHLAGAKVAIDLLGAVRDQHAREPLGQFAAELLVEIEEDRAVLRQLVERVGAGRSSRVKEGIAWLIEKGTRVKLHRRAGRGLGTLQMLETLALGILGKLALWQALAAVAAADSRLRSMDSTISPHALKPSTAAWKSAAWKLHERFCELTPSDAPTPCIPGRFHL